MQPLSLSLLSSSESVSVYSSDVAENDDDWWGGGGSGGFSQKPVCRTKPVSSFIAMWTA